MTSRTDRHQPKQFQIEKFSFETVQSFTYLGSLLDVNNDNYVEIRKRILLANKCFCFVDEKDNLGLSFYP
jgi:hypothetical protein